MESKDFIEDKLVVRKLLGRGMIEQRGKTSGTYYVLSRMYYEFSDEKGKYSKTNWDNNQALMLILEHLKNFEKAKMKDFVDLFQGRLSRKQVRIIVTKLVEKRELKQHGTGTSTFYSVGENFIKGLEIIGRAIEIGMKQMKDNGEI